MTASRTIGLMVATFVIAWPSYQGALVWVEHIHERACVGRMRGVVADLLRFLHSQHRLPRSAEELAVRSWPAVLPMTISASGANSRRSWRQTPQGGMGWG